MLQRPNPAQNSLDLKHPQAPAFFSLATARGSSLRLFRNTPPKSRGSLNIGLNPGCEFRDNRIQVFSFWLQARGKMRNSKFIVSAAVAVSAIAGISTASAADMAVKAPVAPPLIDPCGLGFMSA